MLARLASVIGDFQVNYPFSFMDYGRPLKRVVFMDICSFSSHLIDEAEDDNTEGKERRGEGEGEGEGEQEGRRANEGEDGEEGEENQK
jgi:hypothetical protein